MDSSEEDSTRNRRISTPSENNTRRLLRSLRSLPSNSVSDIEIDDNVPMEIVTSSESDQADEDEDRLFDEYLQQHDDTTPEQFNTELPSEHLYLGQMECVSGLDYYECGKKYRIQVILVYCDEKLLIDTHVFLLYA